MNFNDRLGNPYDQEKRLQDVEANVKRLWLRVTGDGGNGGTRNLGKSGLPVAGTPDANRVGARAGAPVTLPEIVDVAQGMDSTAAGLSQPFVTVTIDGNFTPPEGSIGFTIKVTPSDGASYEVSGPEYSPDADVGYGGLSTIKVKRPPFGFCSFQAKLRTVSGDSPWGPEYAYQVTADTQVVASQTNPWTLYGEDGTSRMIIFPSADNSLVTFHSGVLTNYGAARFKFSGLNGGDVFLGRATALSTAALEVRGGAEIDGTIDIIPDVSTDPSIRNASGYLGLEMSGDEFGGAKLELMNRGGNNGAKFTLNPNDTNIKLLDFIFAYPGGQRQIRLEGRSAETRLGTANEWQLGGAADPDFTISPAGAVAMRGLMQIRSGGTGTLGFNAPSSTGTNRQQGAVLGAWANSTDATRTGRVVLQALDYNGACEGVRVEADGTAARLGFYGATAVAKPAVTGSTGANAALASLLLALSNLGLITNSTSGGGV